jgi:hypothetical protein
MITAEARMTRRRRSTRRPDISASSAPPVATVVGMVADGISEAVILGAYPDLEREDLAEGEFDCRPN